MEPNSPKIIADGKIDVEALLRLTQKPSLLAPNDTPFWDDSHISQGMLDAHLNPTWDAASYRHETIARSVEWLVSHLGLEEGQKVVDLGCGPGLYCERLARHGLSVIGVDYSRRSIEYATGHAHEQGLDIQYFYRNYLTLDFVEQFDAAILIYYDIGVFSDADRDELMRRVWRALKPGGAFVFDVMTPKHPRSVEGETSWKACSSGFWRPGPHLELTKCFQYPEAEAQLRLTTVVEPDGQASVYRLWDRYYSVESITSALESAGFRVQDVWSDLTGRPYDEESPTLGVVARKA